MSGLAGHSGWRWIFIIEGTLTCVLGVLGYFLIVEFPEDAMKSWKFLKEDELKVMVDRVERDRGDNVTPPFHLRSFLQPARDWKIWFFAANLGLASLVSYSSSYQLPVILLNGLGFSEVQAQCLTAPVRIFEIKQLNV